MDLVCIVAECALFFFKERCVNPWLLWPASPEGECLNTDSKAGESWQIYDISISKRIRSVGIFTPLANPYYKHKEPFVIIVISIIWHNKHKKCSFQILICLIGEC